MTDEERLRAVAALSSGHAERDDQDGTITYRRACPTCNGRTAEPGASPCADCRGDGRTTREVELAELYTPELVDFLQAFGPYHAHGLPPTAGGSDDQAAGFVWAANRLEELLAETVDWEQRTAAAGQAPAGTSAPGKGNTRRRQHGRTPRTR